MRVFRKLAPFESWRLRDHLLRLDAEDRLKRFSGAVGEAFIAEHCRRIDWLNAVVIGCFEDGVLRGAAELWPDTPLAGRAELAVTVERPFQNRGIGTALLGRAVTVAGNRAVRSLYMICLLDNRRIQHIARKFDGALTLHDDQAEADITVPYPTQLSLWEEAAADGFGFVGMLMDQFRLEGDGAGSG